MFAGRALSGYNPARSQADWLPHKAPSELLLRHGCTERQDDVGRDVTLHAHRGGRGAESTQYFLSFRTLLAVLSDCQLPKLRPARARALHRERTRAHIFLCCVVARRLTVGGQPSVASIRPLPRLVLQPQANESRRWLGEAVR